VPTRLPHGMSEICTEERLKVIASDLEAGEETCSDSTVPLYSRFEAHQYNYLLRGVVQKLSIVTSNNHPLRLGLSPIRYPPLLSLGYPRHKPSGRRRSISPTCNQLCQPRIRTNSSSGRCLVSLARQRLTGAHSFCRRYP
jgi:hypothetical protein